MCIEGFKLANGAGESSGKPRAPSEDEFEAMVNQFADQPIDWAT